MALRRHPATTRDWCAAAAIADPFGEGSTKRGVNGARRNAAGDSDPGAAVLVARRSTANTASFSSANTPAVSSRH